jgi:hypothetical protein
VHLEQFKNAFALGVLHQVNQGYDEGYLNPRYLSAPLTVPYTTVSATEPLCLTPPTPREFERPRKTPLDFPLHQVLSSAALSSENMFSLAQTCTALTEVVIDAVKCMGRKRFGIEDKFLHSCTPMGGSWARELSLWEQQLSNNEALPASTPYPVREVWTSQQFEACHDEINEICRKVYFLGEEHSEPAGKCVPMAIQAIVKGKRHAHSVDYHFPGVSKAGIWAGRAVAKAAGVQVYEEWYPSDEEMTEQQKFEEFEPNFPNEDDAGLVTLGQGLSAAWVSVLFARAEKILHKVRQDFGQKTADAVAADGTTCYAFGVPPTKLAWGGGRGISLVPV